MVYSDIGNKRDIDHRQNWGSLALRKIRIFSEKSSILKVYPLRNGLEDTDEDVVIFGQFQSK